MLTPEEKQEIQTHCDQYKNCKGCPFVGGACVAPVSDHKFNEWLAKMLESIKKTAPNKKAHNSTKERKKL